METDGRSVDTRLSKHSLVQHCLCAPDLVGHGPISSRRY